MRCEEQSRFTASYSDYDVSVTELLGQTVLSVKQYGDQIDFILDDGTVFVMHHYQDCCESVSIEDIVGDLQDLVGHPILEAEVVSNSEDPATSEWEESWTWTYYKFGTIKGHVNIRWYGSSNGYYSESVSFTKLKKKAFNSYQYDPKQSGDTDDDI